MFENIQNNKEKNLSEELPYFVDEKNTFEEIKKLREKQEAFEDKDSIEFKEIEIEVKNLRFKDMQAETFRMLSDNEFSQEEKDDEVERLRKSQLRKIIFEKQTHFDKYNNGIVGDTSDFALEIFLAKRELYGETPELKEKIEKIIEGFKQSHDENDPRYAEVPKFGFNHKRLQDMDGDYFINFDKYGYQDKLKADIEERKKEGYVFMQDKEGLGKSGVIGVQRHEDGRIDYSSSARMLSPEEKAELVNTKSGNENITNEENTLSFEDDLKNATADDLFKESKKISQTIKDLRENKIEMSLQERRELILKKEYISFKGSELDLSNMIKEDPEFYDEGIEIDMSIQRKSELKYLNKKYNYENDFSNDDTAKLKLAIIGALDYEGSLDFSVMGTISKSVIDRGSKELVDKGYSYTDIDKIFKSFEYLTKENYIKDKNEEYGF
jgi:hypothetical protein